MPEPANGSQAEPDANPTPAERRADMRHRPNRYLLIRVLAKPSFQSDRAVIKEISRRNIGLVLARSFEPGTLLAIELQSRLTGVSGILTAKVRRVAPEPGGNWFLGCTLSRPLSDEALLELM